jgi:hypothetical protein
VTESVSFAVQRYIIVKKTIPSANGKFKEVEEKVYQPQTFGAPYDTFEEAQQYLKTVQMMFRFDLFEVRERTRKR